jgi:hypothetical protein
MINFGNFAFNYWTGTDHVKAEEKEILFEGIVHVEEVYADLTEFSQQ